MASGSGGAGAKMTNGCVREVEYGFLGTRRARPPRPRGSVTSDERHRELPQPDHGAPLPCARPGRPRGGNHKRAGVISTSRRRQPLPTAARETESATPAHPERGHMALSCAPRGRRYVESTPRDVQAGFATGPRRAAVLRGSTNDDRGGDGGRGVRRPGCPRPHHRGRIGRPGALLGILQRLQDRTQNKYLPMEHARVRGHAHRHPPVAGLLRGLLLRALQPRSAGRPHRGHLPRHRLPHPRLASAARAREAAAGPARRRHRRRQGLPHHARPQVHGAHRGLLRTVRTGAGGGGRPRHPRPRHRAGPHPRGRGAAPQGGGR